MSEAERSWFKINMGFINFFVIFLLGFLVVLVLCAYLLLVSE